jgi:hypothetical protein
MLDLEEELKKAQLQKAIEEVEKLKAEKLKLDLEKVEIDKRINTPFLKSNNFYQVIWTAIISVPIIWFYFENAIQPVLKRNEYELLNSKDSLLALKKNHLKDSINFIASTRDLQKRSFRFDSIVSLIKSLTDSIGQLHSKSNWTVAQKGKFEKQVTEIKYISDFGQLNTFKIGIYFKVSKTNQANQIKNYLINKGFKGECELYPKDKAFFKYFNYTDEDDFQIRYEPDTELAVATKLNEILDKNELKVNFNLKTIKNRSYGFLSIFIPG